MQNINLSWSYCLWGRVRSCIVLDPVNKVDDNTLMFLGIFLSVGWYLATAFTIFLITLHKDTEEDFWNASDSGNDRASVFKVRVF